VNDEIEQSARDLWRWAVSRGFEGHDPHDLLNSPILRVLPRGQAWLPRTLRLAALQLGRRLPVNLRPIARVPATRNAKGLALFLRGLLSAKERITEDWHEQADTLREGILELQHPNGGWGYPFAWQSRTHYVPEGKPNIVTTAFCGLALLDWLDASAEQASTESVKRAVERAIDYIVTRLPRYEGVAFGYAEEDPQVVFNAALLGAELLARASVTLGKTERLTLATDCARFVARHQRSDGSWIYGLEPSQIWIDSFHTGFVIDSMFRIAEIAADFELEVCAKSGLEYYLRQFIAKDGSVRYFPQEDYPIDAHAVGQAISMLSRHGHVAEAKRVADWAIHNLRSDGGYFYYQKHRHYTNKIAYMRWSNAWMFTGLADLLAHE
jgi:hypothetical protein